MNSVLEKVRSKYPEYGSVDDAELTRKLGQKYPQYLSIPDFKAEYDLLTQGPVQSFEPSLRSAALYDAPPAQGPNPDWMTPVPEGADSMLSNQFVPTIRGAPLPSPSGKIESALAPPKPGSWLGQVAESAAAVPQGSMEAVDILSAGPEQKREMLLCAFAEHQRKAEGSKSAQVVGGLLGSIGIAAPQALLGPGALVSIPATFASSAYGHSWFDAGIRALSEGKPIDEAVGIANRVAGKSAVIQGGVAAVMGPLGKIGLPRSTGALTTVAKGGVKKAVKDIAQGAAAVGGLAAGGAVTENIVRQAEGLDVSTGEGVLENALIMGLTHTTVAGVSRFRNTLDALKAQKVEAERMASEAKTAAERQAAAEARADVRARAEELMALVMERKAKAEADVSRLADTEQQPIIPIQGDVVSEQGLPVRPERRPLGPGARATMEEEQAAQAELDQRLANILSQKAAPKAIKSAASKLGPQKPAFTAEEAVELSMQMLKQNVPVSDRPAIRAPVPPKEEQNLNVGISNADPAQMMLDNLDRLIGRAEERIGLKPKTPPPTEPEGGVPVAPEPKPPKGGPVADQIKEPVGEAPPAQPGVVPEVAEGTPRQLQQPPGARAVEPTPAPVTPVPEVQPESAKAPVATEPIPKVGLSAEERIFEPRSAQIESAPKDHIKWFEQLRNGTIEFNAKRTSKSRKNVLIEQASEARKELGRLGYSSDQIYDVEMGRRGIPMPEPTAMAKEPWQQTYREFMGIVNPTSSLGNSRRNIHEQLVKEAVLRGDEVPPEVLADYPDLKPTLPQPETVGKTGQLEPPVAEGYTRLWRGETKPRPPETSKASEINRDTFEPEEFKGRWFTEDRATTEPYTRAIHDPGGRQMYVDVPTKDLDLYRVSKNPAAKTHSLSPSKEFVLPLELAKTAKQATEILPQPETAGKGGEKVTAAIPSEPSPQSLGITPQLSAPAKAAAGIARPLVRGLRLYSEQIPDRIRRLEIGRAHV